MKAKDIMTRPVTTVGPDAQIQQIAQTLLNRHISAVPVVDEQGGLLGIVSEGDLVRHAKSGSDIPAHRSWWLSLLVDIQTRADDYIKQHGRFAHEIMTTPVITVNEDASLPEIATLLEKEGIKRVPVVANGRVTGIVSRANLLYGLAALRPPNQEPRDDRDLSTAIDTAISESGINSSYLTVVVTDGIARLWGVVESESEHQAINVVLENMDGLQGIENNVRITSLTGAGY